MDSYADEQGAPQDSYDGQRDYPPRERSRSPRPEYRDSADDRVRDDDMNGRERDDRSAQPLPPKTEEEEEEARNPGTNLFVTGIHPRLLEEDLTRLFEKYGTVEKANIMRDPHTRESRGFGFVNMATAQEADAAKEGLQGENYEGRTLSIEKARRAKPRTSTPGKYFGPPKRDDFRSRGRFDDRRGGSSYGGRRDDGPYGGRGGGGGGRYEDRGYGGGGGGGRRYDDRGGSDRYSGGSRGPPRESRRDDYGGGGGSYRSGGDAGGSRYEDRAPRGEPREARDSYR